ncbi:hypothetical protein ACS0TY_001729 [Phlomoides rotata]
MSPLIFLPCILFLLLIIPYSFQIPDNDWNHLRTSVDRTPKYNIEEPEYTVFFHYKDLKVGSKMKIYFPPKDPSTTPTLLSHHESHPIPFSSSQFPQILALFSFSDGSKQAEAIKSTLDACEFLPYGTMFCATSKEQMLDSVGRIFGPNSEFRVVKTNYLSESLSILQNYTITEAPVERSGPMSVACHMLPYPYAVYFCHGQYSDYNKVYKVSLVGDDGGRVEAAAVCHLDTSRWDPENPAFGVLGTVPGALPVCHYFHPDNLASRCKKASLAVLMLRIPKPPSSLGAHTLVQFTV